MNYLNCKSFAKLNSCLHIINRRDDGYHNIESIFHTIDIYDTLSFKKNNNKNISFTCNSSLIDRNENLVTEAFDIMSHRYSKVSGLDIFLDKVIPIGAGLGGGSSNAAITLLAINKLFNLQLSGNILKNIAMEIGSDIPFFIEGGTSFVQGRGEIIHKIPFKKKYFIIILSKISISTGEIYKKLSSDSFMPKKSYSELASSKFNSFEYSVMSEYPELKETKYWLSSFGSVRMSGTGSTLFIEYADYSSALEANKEIKKKYNSIVVSSLESYENFT